MSGQFPNNAFISEAEITNGDTSYIVRSKNRSVRRFFLSESNYVDNIVISRSKTGMMRFVIMSLGELKDQPPNIRFDNPPQIILKFLPTLGHLYTNQSYNVASIPSSLFTVNEVISPAVTGSFNTISPLVRNPATFTLKHAHAAALYTIGATGLVAGTLDALASTGWTITADVGSVITVNFKKMVYIAHITVGLFIRFATLKLNNGGSIAEVRLPGNLRTAVGFYATKLELYIVAMGSNVKGRVIFEVGLKTSIWIQPSDITLVTAKIDNADSPWQCYFAETPWVIDCPAVATIRSNLGDFDPAGLSCWEIRDPIGLFNSGDAILVKNINTEAGLPDDGNTNPGTGSVGNGDDKGTIPEGGGNSDPQRDPSPIVEKVSQSTQTFMSHVKSLQNVNTTYPIMEMMQYNTGKTYDNSTDWDAFCEPSSSFNVVERGNFNGI